MQIWILTFNRKEALNRLISHFGSLGYKPNIFSNHPEIKVARDNMKFIGEAVVNTLNTHESNSWCARSWNSILMKTFNSDNEEAILIQDDTDIAPTFSDWINREKQKYDFIWGPAGDQFHYIHKKVLQKVGWWDERYIGCYCGDAEYVKRVYMEYDRDRISVQDTHNWGFHHNPCGVMENIVTTYESKTIDPDYDNQHWELERKLCCGNNTSSNNPTLKHSQQHFRNKWGVDLDNNRPVIDSLNRAMPEIDWYPWATKKFGITYYENNRT